MGSRYAQGKTTRTINYKITKNRILAICFNSIRGQMFKYLLNQMFTVIRQINLEFLKRQAIVSKKQ